MADLQFPNLGNALLAGSQAAYYQGRARKEQADEQRRIEAQPYIQGALKGDTDAFGKLAAGDPTTAATISTMLSRLDTNQRAKLKDAADYTAHGANAILQADPAMRPTVYKQIREDGIRRGYNLDSLPPEYSPNIDGLLRSHRMMGMSIKDQMELQQNEPVKLPPLGGGGQAGGAAPNRDQFVATMMPHALEVSKATGLDPRLVIAQSALETGYGAAAPGNNYFGIKSHGQAGGQTLGTTEVGPGGAYQTQDSFRTYADPGASAQDYAQFLKTNSRYAPVLGAKGLDAQIEAMGKSGYATDPNYAAKLRQIAQTIPAGAAPGTPGPIAGSPLANSVPQVNTAQMPNAPAGLTPQGPPPAQMPQPTGMVAQGDGSGQPVIQNGFRIAPEAALKPEVLTVREQLRDLRPGWGIILHGKNRDMSYDAQGRLKIYGPNGEEDAIALPKPETPASGYRAGPNGTWVPVPGGPHDKPQGGGPFTGNAMDAQAHNIVLRGDPSTPDYAAAYAHLAAERATVDAQTGNVTRIKPDMSWARPPAFNVSGGLPGMEPSTNPGAKTIETTQGKGKALDNSARDDLDKKAGSTLELAELLKSFKPSYGGYGADVLGDARNMARRNLPAALGGGDPTGEAQWWQRYDSVSNIERNKLFGASLTAGEQAAWKKATVTPGMQPEQIKENLQRQSDIAAKATSRLVHGMVESGYNQKAIEAATGIRMSDLPDPMGGVPQAQPTMKLPSKDGSRPPLESFER